MGQGTSGRRVRDRLWPRTAPGTGCHAQTAFSRPLARVRQAIFHHDPLTAANHTGVEESIYWGDAHDYPDGGHSFTTSLRGSATAGKYRGHVEGEQVLLGRSLPARNQVLPATSPSGHQHPEGVSFMPYHDPAKPFVEPLVCIERRTRRAMVQSLPGRNAPGSPGARGRGVHHVHPLRQPIRRKPPPRQPVPRTTNETAGKKTAGICQMTTLLDYLLKLNGPHQITDSQRSPARRKWLWEKMFTGTS